MGDMADSDTGIVLHNKLADFSALNCRWANSSNRNPQKIKEKQKVIRIPKVRQNANLSICLHKDHVQWLKMQACSESIKRKKRVSVNRMISELIEKHMPHPKTIDMLGDKYG